MHSSLAFAYLAALCMSVKGSETQQTLLSSPTPCQLLYSRFPGQVALPEDSNYDMSQAMYWIAQQSKMRPKCHFFPNSATAIQTALSHVFVPQNVSIAIASGGHSTNPGASNVDEGITIDLSNLADIELSEDTRYVALGPGARWGDVYTALEPHGLTIPGARVSDVGVGGFVLGGGISWFAEQLGWACDSVIEFEIVTPNAEILRINKSDKKDLFWAVKGSLGAFGIITKVKMPTLKSSQVYAGLIGYHWRFTPRVIHALQNLNERASVDPSTKGFLTVAWIEAEKRFAYTAYLVNIKGHTWNEVFAAFKVIRPMVRTLRMTTFSDSASEINNNDLRGKRRTKFTLTCQSSYEVMMTLHELVKEYITRIDFDHDSIMALSFQPLTIPHLLHQNLKPNIFNLNPSQGPLVLVSLEFQWSNPNHDTYFETHAHDLRSVMKAQIDLLRATHDFVYPNYAHSDQNPFEAGVSVSPADAKRLKQIMQKYDPRDVWRRLVPGVWHVT